MLGYKFISGVRSGEPGVYHSMKIEGNIVILDNHNISNVYQDVTKQKLFILFFLILFFNFTILYWFCHILK